MWCGSLMLSSVYGAPRLMLLDGGASGLTPRWAWLPVRSSRSSRVPLFNLVSGAGWLSGFSAGRVLVVGLLLARAWRELLLFSRSAAASSPAAGAPASLLVLLGQALRADRALVLVLALLLATETLPCGPCLPGVHRRSRLDQIVRLRRVALVLGVRVGHYRSP